MRFSQKHFAKIKIIDFLTKSFLLLINSILRIFPFPHFHYISTSYLFLRKVKKNRGNEARNEVSSCWNVQNFDLKRTLDFLFLFLENESKSEIFMEESVCWLVYPNIFGEMNANANGKWHWHQFGFFLKKWRGKLQRKLQQKRKISERKNSNQTDPLAEELARFYLGVVC